ANGNLRSDGSRVFTYDLNNTIQTISDGTSGINQVKYYRDALGRVISESSPTQTIFRTYDDATMITEFSSSTTGRTEFTAGHLPDEVMHVAKGGQDYWLVHDSLRSMRVLSNNSGGIVSIPLFRPFGCSEDTELNLSPFHFGFAGMWYTDGLPFYHSTHRSYRPDVGRYMQRDAFG